MRTILSKSLSRTLFFVLAIAAMTVACKKGQPAIDVPDVEEDPFNIVNTAKVGDGKILDFTTGKLGEKDFYAIKIQPKDAMDTFKVQPESKLHPLFQKWAGTKAADERIKVIVRFPETTKIPRFPEPRINEPRTSEYNQAAMKKAENMVASLEKRRLEEQGRYIGQFEEKYKAKVLERFWLINAVVMELPFGAVQEMAQSDNVMYIEPEQSEDYPPQNANNADDVDDGRGRMVSDPYFNVGLPFGWIGLLDSGVRGSHNQFNSPDHVDFMRDCVNGGADCNTGPGLNPNDDCWNHGTSSAAIITGNNRPGAAFRGVTEITLDNFKVYPSTFDAAGNCNGGLNDVAAVRGFQRAVLVLDRVIVAEMQGSGGSNSAISIAADNAFDAGAVIIAANGNNGAGAGTVNTPANAHRVIGVGNFDVQSGDQVASQSRGPASDNRFKPDIQAPTNTETASNASDNAFRVFGGTSGATPYASGAAALLRNWLRGSNSSIDPGQVYAQLILSGQQTYPFNNTSGAGPLQLPTNGWAWWGKVSISNGVVCDIPLNINGANTNTFDGALWWPETEGGSHNDIDLALVDPSGRVVSNSISVSSVFERARAAGAVPNGLWKLRITGYSVTGTQTVNWSAHVRL